MGETDELTDELAEVMKELAPESCFVQSYFNIPFPKETLVKPPTAPIDIAKNTHPDDKAEFLEELNLSKNEIENLAESTISQRNSDDWHTQRIGRITASKFHSVSVAIDKFENNTFSKQTIDNLSSDIMGYSKPVLTKSMKHGISEEQTAKRAYIKTVKSSKKHVDFQCKESGLNVMNEYPYIGASPDMVIDCKCHGKGLVEIKCPYSICEQAPSTSNYNHINSDGHLKKTSPYYTQVQGQMGVIGVKYCDFFVYTRHGFLIDRVEFDLEFWQNLLAKVEKFWHNFIAPELLNGTLHETVAVPLKMATLDHCYNGNESKNEITPQFSTKGPLSKPILPNVYLCETCGTECKIQPTSSTEQSILCNMCNRWEHLQCAGLQSEYHARQHISWLCTRCKNSRYVKQYIFIIFCKWEFPCLSNLHRL